MRIRAALFLCGLALAFPAHAQQQVVRPPIAIYWMSVDTMSGMGAGMGGGMNVSSMMGAMMGGSGGDGATRTMLLQLGSSQSAAGEPRAAHDIPIGLNMGPSLPLITPKRAAPGRNEDLPEGMEQPKGRMKIYWGCGDKVGAGQPVIIDFAKVAAGQRPPNMVSRRIAGASGPSAGRNRTYSDWPNSEDSKAVPAGASLRGEHLVNGNYSPEIKFPIGERHDFMAPVSFSPLAKTAAGGMRVQWKSVSGATGYFATAFGGTEGSNDVIMWSSSEVQEMGGALMGFVPPAEVARLIREKVVMTPQTTECTVPGQVVKEMGEGGMLRFVAYGDELNLVHPPRPQDVKQPWEQVWAVKVRLKSSSGLMLAEGMGGMDADPAERRPAQARPDAPAQTQPQSSGTAVEQGVQEGLKALKGLFGR
ncbi:MAG: hypothetical protein Q8K18_04495 [Burkholderiales bacterium]|nr:hypothetical protein [Burkholderiales bacterium]